MQLNSYYGSRTIICDTFLKKKRLSSYERHQPTVSHNIETVIGIKQKYVGRVKRQNRLYNMLAAAR